MTEADRLARKRYYLIAAVNMLGTAGAVLGLVIAGRSQDQGVMIFGGVILLSSLYFMAVVPRFLARRWKTPAEVLPEA